MVDTALAITGAERGFLLLRAAGGLETKVARHRHGHNLRETDLRVPREVIRRALEHRRELLSMNFDPLGAAETRPQNSIADLELRSAICVPLVRIRAGLGDATSLLSTGNETVGVLYMDSRLVAADMAGGNRELLQTLAIEASTVLENARLLAGGAVQAPDGRGTAAGAHHPAEPASRQPARRRDGCAPAEAASRRTRWAATTTTSTSGDRALLVGGGGRCLRQGRGLGAAGVAAAGRADHGDGESRWRWATVWSG